VNRIGERRADFTKSSNCRGSNTNRQKFPDTSVPSM
jgi:hypothetical protein